MTAPGEHIHGWMSDTELNWLCETAKKMDTIVEIGAFEGRSTFALCTGCPGLVIVVDHFKGSEEHQGREESVIKGNLFEVFMSHVGHFKNLSILRMDSAQAVNLLRPLSIDMVFIDGSHDYESVRSDIVSWFPKTKKLICGHDYQDAFKGVKQAVDEAFPNRNVLVDRIWGFFI